MNPRTFVRISLVLVLLSCAAWGQGFGTINGQVTDATGAAVPDAKVTLTESNTGRTRTAASGQDGFYTLVSMQPSTYTLTAEAKGFKTITLPGIVLQASQSLTVDLPLTVGLVTESVTVNNQIAQVDTTTATLKEVVDSTRMVEIPLNGRNAASLTTLVAGAVISPLNNADQGNAKTFPAAVTISINGTRENQTGYYLDGAPNIDFMTNVNQPFPFPDALQEFSVQTSNYSAEYGQAAGGIVSIVSKSGTNRYHGTAFEFVRNGVFNAENYFASTVDSLKRNQYGGTFGGPVRKDRTFFFGGYQGTRIRSNVQGLSAYVPTDANRAGDFSSYLSATNPNNPLKKAINLNAKAPTLFTTGDIAIPGTFDPASLALLANLPHAQGNGFVTYSTPISQNFDEYILRGDHAITSKDKLVGRYYYDHFSNIGSYGGNLLAYRQGSTISSHNAVIEETHIFNSNLLNDLRFGFNRVVSIREPPPSAPSVTDYGVKIYTPPQKAIQSIATTGFFTLGANPTAKFPRTGYSLYDDFRWVHGKHSFAFGGNFEIQNLFMKNILNLPGVFSFSGDTTGLALADYMTGKLRTFQQTNGQHVKNHYWILNGYTEDSFRATNRISLTFGIRYEPQQVWHDDYEQQQVFFANQFAAGKRSVVYPNAPPGLFFPGDPGVPQNGTRPSYTNVSPRAGFAWDTFGKGNTSVRGGIGIFYDSRMMGFSNDRLWSAAPFAASVNFTTPAGPFSNPYLGQVNPFPAVFPAPSSAAFSLPVQVFSWDPVNKFITPRTYMLNLAIEQNVGRGFVARAAYVGSRGQHMTVTLDQDPATYYPASSTGSACTLTTDQRRRYNNLAGTCVNSAPPVTNFTNIYQQSNSGNSWYHSGQFSLTKPLSHGFTILANYTWSKSTDNLPYGTDAASFGTNGYYTAPITQPNFRRFDEGPSDFNHAHVVFVSYVWQTPKFETMNWAVRHFLGDWEATGILSAESGAPLTLYYGQDISGTGINLDRPQYSGTGGYAKGRCSTTQRCVGWLNSAAFTAPAPGQLGNVGKGQFIGPGYWNWDMGFFKNIPIHENISMQFRTEFFNTFNHPNFQVDDTGSRAKNPIQTVTAAGFGQIQSANDPRIIQFALKIVF
jgi:hypothetical protein